jgi:chromosome segregation ATPase
MLSRQNQLRSLQTKLQNIEKDDQNILQTLRSGLSASSNAISWIEDQIKKSRNDKEQISRAIHEVENKPKDIELQNLTSEFRGSGFQQQLKIQPGDPIRVRNFIHQVFEKIEVQLQNKISLK